ARPRPVRSVVVSALAARGRAGTRVRTVLRSALSTVYTASVGNDDVGPVTSMLNGSVATNTPRPPPAPAIAAPARRAGRPVRMSVAGDWITGCGEESTDVM